MLLLILTWLYYNPRGKFKLPEKAKSNLKYTYCQNGVVKQYNHVQSVATKLELFDFDTTKYEKYFEVL